MAAPRLTVDLGNSSAKLRLWSQPDAPAAGLAVESPLDPALARFLESLPGGTRAGLCAVGASGLEAAFAERLERALGAGALARPAPGIENACREPHTTGLDRLFAARGGFERLATAGRAGRGFLVVDAGTALTVDAVEVGPAGPRFLGGAIAPGPRLLAQVLSSGTARLPRLTPAPGVPALGRDTRAAILSGVAVGFRGAARELLRRVAEEAGLVGAVALVSGGARAFLLEPEPFVDAHGDHPLLIDPELVHRGLLAALEDPP